MRIAGAAAGGGATKFSPAAKPCDYCKSTAALLFCRRHAAFTCIPCDTKLHAAVPNHDRVWLCEVCEAAPAAVTCKADAAALCAACDRHIHSANPLAGRHDRLPALPFYGTAQSDLLKSTAALLIPAGEDDRKFDINVEQSGYIPDSWIPTTTTKLREDGPDLMFFQDSDQFLDFDHYQISSQPYSDSVVPVQPTNVNKSPVPVRLTRDPVPETRFDIDFSRSNINSYNNTYTNTTASLSHSVSSSSMEVGVVPDGSSLSEISYSIGQSINSGADQIGKLDREARVLRYKEKRKNRKFEKTIRYASRKAYAETRPRIKGRFAKRTDSDSDLDLIFGAGAANFVADARYGIVPSF